MGLKPYDKKISQIFNNVQYDVDFYQREYKWNDELEYKPVSSLLKDIFYRFDLEKYNPNQEINQESTEKLEWYYLNTFMTNLIKGKKYIVDGQQRLTTLTLVSIGLYHLAIKHKLEQHIIDSLKNSIVGVTEFGKTFWMGFKDRKTALEDILDNNIGFKGQNDDNNISEKNIYRNYGVILNSLDAKFATPHKLQTFISYFRHRVYLIEIEIDKDKDVAMVFEVINDRGVPLKPYEILKGKILSQIDIADREKYIKIWETQIEKIEKNGENEIDEFFGFYFRSKFSDNAEQYSKLDKTRYHKTIFMEEYDQKIGLKNNEEKARLFVEKTLPYFSNIYIEMLKYYHDYNKNYESVYFNKLNDMDGQFVLTLSSIELDDTMRDEKLKLIPKYFDKFFTLCNLTNSYKSNEFNTNVISLSIAIRNSALDIAKIGFDNQLLTVVKKKYDRDTLDEAFKYEFFRNIGYNDFGRTFLRYYFARIDHYISDFSNESEYGSYYQLVAQTQGANVYHIEHIITNNEENLKLFKDEEEFNQQRNRLGGLLLLKGKDNQSSGDELYEDKLKTYNVVGTYYARTLLPDMYHKKVAFKKFITDNNLNFKSYATYGKDEIEERHNLLYELTKRIWN
ncbi:MAG: DUF262 domain-containing protein [Flavobacterium sp.]|uniref:DUF262 domain-containing protein n=1 Tax=Flavobacterium sp. TaxID=239 RepID=UPI003BCE55B4